MSALLTDAGGHGRAALLVALGAAVAGDASDTILAGALACGLVACLACCAHRVAVTSWGGGGWGKVSKRDGVGQIKEIRDTSSSNLLQNAK